MDDTGRNCNKHLSEMLKEDENVFLSISQIFVTEWETLCSFAFEKDAKIIRDERSTSFLTLHAKDCIKDEKISVSDVCEKGMEDEEIQSNESSTNIIIFISIAVTILVCLIFFLLFCMKKKGVIRKKDDAKKETIVHQNELYGNVSNEDYFNERYATNIVDKNQYYDDEYQA